jgi:hypothetical protein
VSWTFDSDDRQAVGLHLDLPSQYVAEAKPGINRRKGDRHLLLNVVDAQPWNAQPAIEM